MILDGAIDVCTVESHDEIDARRFFAQEPHEAREDDDLSSLRDPPRI